MAESRDESKMASSTPASVARSRGSGGRRSSSSSSRSSTPSKAKTSAERKKRKQRKPPAVDEVGSKEDAQPPREANGKPSTQQPAGAPVEVRQGTPARVLPDQRRDVTPDLSVAKTLTSQQPLDSQREATHGLIVPWVPLAEPPNLFRDDVTARDDTHESVLRRTSLSGPSQLPCDDVHNFIAQVAPRAPEEVNVPTASKWSLRRPARVFNIGQKIGRGSKETFCKLLLIGTAALVIGVALAKHFSKVKVPPAVAFCSTEDCTKFGLEIRAAINSAADPCTDFHSFVCGGWDDPKRQESTEARMMAAAADLAIAEAEADTGHGSKATQFFHSCDTASVQRVENLQEFAELRRSLGLTWPEQVPNGSAHPLGIMVDLAINWEMNFLFDMSAVPVRESVALLFSRGRLDASWEQSVQYAWPLYEYEDYVKKYYGILGVAEEGVHLQAAELLKLERAILLAKVAFLYDAPRQRWFKLSDMDSQTKTTSAALWLSFLTTHDKQFSWTADSTVITEDVHIFRMIDKLMKEFNHNQLIVGLSWIFIQSHLWAVYGEPSIRFRGPSETLLKFKRRGCMDYVDSRLGLLSLSKTINDRYGSSENRLQVVSFLYRINQNIKRLLRNLTWMDEDSKRVAYLKLEKIVEVVMPNDTFFERRNLEELYSVFPRMAGKTFVTNMVTASEVYRGLRNHEHFEDVYSIRVYPRYGREMYLYLPNLLKLAFVDLFPPLFFKNATLAIIYGGLGSFAARQMAKSFDDVGVTVDHKGRSGIWLGPNAAAVHAEKASCNVRASSYGGEWRPLRLFPVVAGLEIAYQSYVAAVSSDYLALEDFRVKHLENFTDDQVFFLTYCYALCSKRLQTMGDECNVPLKNSKRFAEAFGCPEKSRMNPRTKCTFFDP